MKKSSMLTAGIDIGDRKSEVRILDDNGDVIEELTVQSTLDDITKHFGPRPKMVVILEAGTHSPWMSRTLRKLGHNVLVANPRKASFIYNNNNKGDDVDAELLARVGRVDPKLLFPIEHKSEEAQQYLAVIKSRDAVVRARTMLVNHARGTVKAIGERLPATATSRFHKLDGDLPQSLQPALSPIMEQIANLNAEIKNYDKEIAAIIQEHFPQAYVLQQIAGVGPVTALTFILMVGDVERFNKNRSVGAYFGLTPRRNQSGEDDPELHISKAGNTYMRRLLVNAAQYILGPFGPDTDLRHYGTEIATRGGKKARRRAVVAVARKLSVLMLCLLKSGEVYEPLRLFNQRMKAA